MTGHNT